MNIKQNVRSSLTIIFVTFTTSLINSCGVHHQKGAIPTSKEYGYYKVGNPYKVKGKWYYPKKQDKFEEVGIASWYGPSFHGEKTANGATFNAGALSVAHRTLPLPSVVKVTNLENNRSVIATVNDRGPFSKSRVADVSKRVAEILDFKNKGTAKIRIELLPDKTQELLASLGYNPDNSTNKQQQVAANYTPTDDEVFSTPAPNPKIALNVQSHLSDKIVVPVLKPVNHYVQAGTFGSKNNAEVLKTKLASLGHVEINKVKVSGKEVYKVVIGPWSNKANANNALKVISKLGHDDALIVSSNN